MRVNVDRRKLWVLLPVALLTLTAPAAFAGDNPGPALPNQPAVPGAPAAPSAPEAPSDSEGPLRHTDLPGMPQAPSAPQTPPAPGIPYLLPHD